MIGWCTILLLCILSVLPATMAWGTATSEVEFAKGLLAYGKKHYAKAREHFQTVVTLEPDNPHAPLYLGLSLRYLGAFRAAVAALQQALQLDPSLSYIHYHLGVTFYQMERDEQAKEAFQAFLATSPEEPEAGLARQNLRAIANQRQREQRLVQLEATIGFEYDDNVILEPNDEALAFGKQGDGRSVFTFVGRLLPVHTKLWRLGAVYRLYQSLHFDLTEFNVQEHTGGLFARYKRDRLTWRLAADYTYTTLDNTRFSEAVTVLPSLTIRATQRLPTVLSIRYQNSNYFNQLIFSGQEDVRDRDGWSIQPSVDQYLLFGAQGAYARFSYAFEASRHDGSDWESDSHRVSLGLYTPLVWGITLDLDGTYVRRDYLHPHSFDAAPQAVRTIDDRRERHDNRVIGSVELQRKLGRPLFFSDLVLTAGFQHTSNFSNIDFFDYRRNIVTLMLTGRY